MKTVSLNGKTYEVSKCFCTEIMNLKEIREIYQHQAHAWTHAKAWLLSTAAKYMLKLWAHFDLSAWKAWAFLNQTET